MFDPVGRDEGNGDGLSGAPKVRLTEKIEDIGGGVSGGGVDLDDCPPSDRERRAKTSSMVFILRRLGGVEQNLRKSGVLGIDEGPFAALIRIFCSAEVIGSHGTCETSWLTGASPFDKGSSGTGSTSSTSAYAIRLRGARIL